MYSFLNDYSEGAHPEVLKALVETNDVQSVGYGLDEYCEQARNTIKEKIGRDADVHFLVGGTQTNATFISYVLKDYQGVIACDEGHINVHETGAIEATGHKVLVKPHVNGKLTVDNVKAILEEHPDEHMVMPKMIYISQTTELGTYYTKEEMEALYKCAKENHLYMFIDGARLGSALAIEDAPTLKEMANLCDAFYIGGTKLGALFGEALVILNDDLKPDFRFQMKQKGAMLAKGRLLGVQFDALLKDDLYVEIGKHENKMAQMIRDAFIKKGFNVFLPSSTNIIFVDLTNDIIEKLSEHYLFAPMYKLDENTKRARFVTSWATKEEEVVKFVKYIEEM